MMQTPVITLDLNFQGYSNVIASYLIQHADGAVLIESGPGSTRAGLEAGLAKEGLSPRDVTHVLLTHIHLDHAGAAGWLARQGRKSLCIRWAHLI
jgi:glyoxylase-like metal-dependent hydrolase (beta-lactamase superfamily II)